VRILHLSCSHPSPHRALTSPYQVLHEGSPIPNPWFVPLGSAVKDLTFRYPVLPNPVLSCPEERASTVTYTHKHNTRASVSTANSKSLPNTCTYLLNCPALLCSAELCCVDVCHLCCSCVQCYIPLRSGQQLDVAPY
jgi:hypothetical protein